MSIAIKGLLILLGIYLVVALQNYLLHDSLTLGFKPDDWILYFSYKSLGDYPLSKIAYTWTERGLYTTYQVYFMGLLDSLFGLNYYSYHWFNLILKILATISLYPLILVVFRSKLLAVLTVILFSISHAAVGPLEFVVKGSDYLAIFWMNLFLLVYYLVISNKWRGWKYHTILTFLFYLSLVFSPIRIFPLIIIPPLIEAFLILRQFNRVNVNKSLMRLFFLYSLLIPVFLFAKPISLHGNASGLIIFYNHVLARNWYILLTPFSGVGYLFITNVWDKLFGLAVTDSLKTYMYFLLGGPTIVAGIITALLVWSRISKYKLIFFILTTILNFVIQVGLYFIAFSNRNYSLTDVYSVHSMVFGAYVVLVGVIVFIYWLRWGDRDRILASFWIAVAFLFIFTFLTWVFAPAGTAFGSTSYYLVVASTGASLMVAALIVSAYEKIKSFRIRFFRIIPLLILIPLFAMSSGTIRSFFIKLNEEGRGAQGQIMMQQEVRKVLKDLKAGDDALVYFDTSQITGHGPFYSEGFLTSFPSFMHLQDGKLVDGCIGVIYGYYGIEDLRKLVQTKNNRLVFYAPAVCLRNGKSSFDAVAFSVNRFYAFRIRDRKLIDIRQAALQSIIPDTLGR